MNDQDYLARVNYIERLRQNRKKVALERASRPKPARLEERIKTWFRCLPEEEKTRPWSMKELKYLFGDTPQKIAAALWDIGWTRKRMWRDDRPTARYWTAP